MIIWLLSLVLLASVAGLGYRQGAIRAGFSLIGILVAVRLAAPLGGLLRPGLLALNLNPVLCWMLGPLAVFIIVLAAFKIAGTIAHQRIELHYKYQAGTVRYGLWERLVRRAGLCVGLINGTVYLALLASMLYAFSYWTVQVATADDEARPERILSNLGRGLQDTGLSKVARAVDRMPASFYDAADVAGLLRNNPLLEARLARYPALLALGQQPEFQDIAQDNTLAELRLRRVSVRELLANPKMQAVVKNGRLLQQIWNVAKPDLEDLRAFLETGRSEKYDGEKLLGRWKFDPAGAATALHRARPDLSALEVQRFRQWAASAFAQTVLIATPDHAVLLRNMPPLRMPSGPPQAIQIQTHAGQWSNRDGQYDLTLTIDGRSEVLRGQIEGERLMVTGGEQEMAFLPED